MATISLDHIPLKPNPIHVLHGGLLFRTYMRYRHLSPPFSLRSIFPTLTSRASLASSSAQKSIDHPPTPPSTMLMDHRHTLVPRVRKLDVTLRQGVQQLTPPRSCTCFSAMSSHTSFSHASQQCLHTTALHMLIPSGPHHAAPMIPFYPLKKPSSRTNPSPDTYQIRSP